MSGREDRIRARAYQLWETDGRPDGREQQHWEQACREVGATEQPAGNVGETKGIVADESGAQFADVAAVPSSRPAQQQSQQQRTARKRAKGN